MPRDTQAPTVDADGHESHPAFGKVVLSRVHASPGASLFDSEIRHPEYVTVKVVRAERERDLNRDWIFGRQTVVEFAVSTAQWADLVSSFSNGDGVPCTLQYTETDGVLPAIPFEPRLALSQAETRGAADRAFAKIREAFEVVDAKPTKANLRSLRAAIENAPSNVEFAARSLTEHTEKVVTKARADIEAMLETAARSRGLAPAETPTLAELTASETREVVDHVTSVRLYDQPSPAGVRGEWSCSCGAGGCSKDPDATASLHQSGANR
jgi:hypothetical protein